MDPQPSTNIGVVDAPEDQTLRLANQELTSEDFVNFSPNFKALVLENCTSKDWQVTFKSIAGLKQLEQLTLRGCRFSKDSLPPLEKSVLQKLTIGKLEMMLDKTSFEDYDLVKLRIPTLTHLIMSTR